MKVEFYEAYDDLFKFAFTRLRKSLYLKVKALTYCQYFLKEKEY